MMSFLEEAQNRAFSSYRATLSPTPDPELAPPGEERRASDAITDRGPTAILERFYQPPAPQMNSESPLDMSDLGTLNPRDNQGSSFSDSGFFSNASGSASQQRDYQQGLGDMTASEPLYPEPGNYSSMYGGAFMQAPLIREETSTDTSNDMGVDFINWDVLPDMGAAGGA
jgi:hypothetical protein